MPLKKSNNSMSLLPVVLLLSESLRPSEILIGEWDVFNGTDSTPVGYFEFHRNQSQTSSLICTVWETGKPGPATLDTIPMLEQALVTFTSSNAGAFTTRHDSDTIPFTFSDGRHLSFVAQRGSFDVTINSSDSIEIRSQDGYLSFVALRQKPIVISKERSRVKTAFETRQTTGRTTIIAYLKENWLAGLVMTVAIFLLFTYLSWLRKRKWKPAGNAVPKVKSE
jgi:hypothetical protein